MNCTLCNQPLRITNNIVVPVTKIEDNVPTTSVFSNQTLVCVNKTCKLYAGSDLNNPLHVAKNVENQIG